MASAADREALLSLLEGLWPEDGFHSVISEAPEGRLQIERRGWVWLVLGPAAGAPLSPERWAEIATSGFVLSNQAQWLSEQYTEEGIRRAVELCVSDAAGAWEQIVTAVPHERPLPDVLVSALTERLRRYEPERGFFALSYIGRRLAESHRLDALRTLAGRDATLADALRKSLARAGDQEAAHALLAETLASLETGHRIDSLDVEWLRGVNDTAFLPFLFDCLATAFRHGLDRPVDVAGPLICTIRRIGGDEAVRCYDEIIEGTEETNFKFLRRARDEVVQDELRKAGRSAAERSAYMLGLPILERNNGAV